MMTSADKNYLEAELEVLLQNDQSIWTFIREGALDGFWYWDLEAPEHEYMSPEFWRTFGFDPETKEHLAAEWQHLIFKEDLETAKENLACHIADPNHPYDQVVRYLCADGSTAWVRCRGVAVRNDDGKPIRLLGAHHDITHQVQKEREAQVSREELETIFNAATSGIVALDADGQIVRINDRARHMLGGVSKRVPFSWPEQIQFLDAEKLAPLDASADPIRRALSGHILRNETHLLRRVANDMDHRYVRVGSANLTNSESRIRVVLVIDDVSNEERNRQVVERKSRLDALGQLTGGIAHDFNNLLASQLYAVDLARKATDPEKRDMYLETAATSIARGRELTSRLLAFARRHPGLASVRVTKDVFAEFAQLVRPMIEAQIDITFDVEEPELRHYCDQTQLETALMNLVLNSRDAILRDGKGNKIDVRARPVRAPTKDLDKRQEETTETEAGADSTFRYVEISVADNGPGMDEETASRSTDPFFTTKDTNSGTGLGLAMVYGFVRQSDGDLRIYSEIGVGTTVQMTLPRGTVLGVREEPMPQDLIARGGGETILVAEDEPILILMLTDVLQELGYKVVTAKSGQEALDIVERGNDFDLLLTDVVMPGKVGGFELARRVRALRPGVPVIYTSGYTGFTSSEMGEVQAPLIQKPAPPAELAEAISQALAGQ
ncbi:MAG: ATP-binding protein [Paracoccaceae bacterium]